MTSAVSAKFFLQYLGSDHRIIKNIPWVTIPYNAPLLEEFSRILEVQLTECLEGESDRKFGTLRDISQGPELENIKLVMKGQELSFCVKPFLVIVLHIVIISKYDHGTLLKYN